MNIKIFKGGDMYSPFDEFSHYEEIENERALMRMNNSRDHLLYQLMKVAKDPYFEKFLGMFLFSYDNDEPNAVELAKEFDFNKKDIVILNEDLDKFIEIEVEEDFIWGGE